MHVRRPAAIILACTALMALLLGQAIATDLPLQPARRAAPAASAGASPLAAPSATCREWTDGCRVCQRTDGGEASCSNVGIACVPKAEQCTRP